MNAVLIIPTGIGCEIGGHAGDATPVAKLLGQCCDKLILHPNVVNASNINEMPDNALYVEGSMLDRFLLGKFELKEVSNNKILVVVNDMLPEIVNTISAARVILGADIHVVQLDIRLEMEGIITKKGLASGNYTGVNELIAQVSKYQFDALAVITHINVSEETRNTYITQEGGVNPWGKIEAIVSNIIASSINKPTAHAPDIDNESFSQIIDPRKAAEFISSTFCFCIFKGLQKAPRVGIGLSTEDIDALILPINVWNDVYAQCRLAGKKIIIVKENKTCFKTCNYPPGNDLIFVNNYLEAAGILMAMKAGIHHLSVRRPILKLSY